MPIARIRQNGIEKQVEYEGHPLVSNFLTEHGFSIQKLCGGHGKCGQCTVEIVRGLFSEKPGQCRPQKMLACQTHLPGDCQIILPERRRLSQIMTNGPMALKPTNPIGRRYGAAVDIGTTTIAVKLFDLQTGAALGTAAAENPQAAHTADVMGRIQQALEGMLGSFQEQVQAAIYNLLCHAARQGGIDAKEIDSLVITGNTAMLYLLTGRNPVSLATAPFQADRLFGEWTSIFHTAAYLPPCIHSFIGADITCALLACGMHQHAKPALLCDIGTNGEIALAHNHNIYVSSTAAGPAFEGANITCGIGSVPGAIDRVWLEQGKLRVHTIGDAPAIGICGSGLIDAISVLLEQGLIDETGAMKGMKVQLADSVTLLPQDIRNVQLAKAALAAGIQTLLKTANLSEHDVTDFYIAGGFANHIHPESAARIGLMPAALKKKAQPLGNAALTGAQMILFDKERIRTCGEMIRSVHHVDLGGNPSFNSLFIEHMCFHE